MTTFNIHLPSYFSSKRQEHEFLVKPKLRVQVSSLLSVCGPDLATDAEGAVAKLKYEFRLVEFKSLETPVVKKSFASLLHIPVLRPHVLCHPHGEDYAGVLHQILPSALCLNVSVDVSLVCLTQITTHSVVL